MDDSSLELTIYPGKDGSFTYYQDKGDGYEYENGAYATTTFIWRDSDKTLIIEEPNGAYEGMTKVMELLIKVVGNGSKMVTYKGKEEKISF